MKRILALLLVCVFLILPVTAEAAVYQDAQYVVDQAGLLSGSEAGTLDSMAEQLSEQYGVDILIAIVDSLEGETAGEYAASLNGSRNWWDTDNAIVYLLALEEREWYIATFGEALYLLTDQDLDQLGYQSADYFSDGRWYDGFEAYLDLLPVYWSMAQQDVSAEDYDIGYPESTVRYESRRSESFLRILSVSALIGLAAAAATVLIMRYSMNTKRRQHSAGDYLTRGSYRLSRQQDIFLYSNVSKVRRQQNSSSSGHSSSGGSRSYGGRGGKF